MLSTGKQKESNRRFPSQLDEFDRNIIFGNAVSNWRKIVVVKESTADQKLTANDTSSNLSAKEHSVNVKTCESCFNERIDKEMGNIVNIVEVKIQSAILPQLMVSLLLK